jgi:penicillin-binding protein 1C
MARPKKVFSGEATFLISDILSDRGARSVTFGLENPLSTRFWTAVKTGTSKDMRDNWCVGYSQKYTVGVWVGNFSGEPMWNVSGISGAAPVWIEIMNRLHAAEKSRSSASQSVVKQEIRFLRA